MKNSNIPFSVRQPLLVPRHSPLALSIVEHYHRLTYHQCSHITHSYLVQSGFHVQNARQVIRSYINNCILCRKLRSATAVQQMSDIPQDRLEETPPFTNVGLDAFGPFFIHEDSSTRKISASKKIWALIFVCMPSRAIHLEPLPAMDASTFRNALTRFVVIRGPCRLIRSDQGTNFVAVRNQLQSIDVKTLSAQLQQQNVNWKLNPPHASHFGGSWERKIGSVRRVLEGALSQATNRPLSKDEFHTLLAEASAKVNNTPLWAVSNLPEDPTPLNPAMLLTFKEDTPTSLEHDFKPSDLLQYGYGRWRLVVSI